MPKKKLFHPNSNTKVYESLMKSSNLLNHIRKLFKLIKKNFIKVWRAHQIKLRNSSVTTALPPEFFTLKESFTYHKFSFCCKYLSWLQWVQVISYGDCFYLAYGRNKKNNSAWWENENVYKQFFYLFIFTQTNKHMYIHIDIYYPTRSGHVIIIMYSIPSLFFVSF